MAATPLYGKNSLKIFFSGTKGPMILGFGMQHQGLGPNKIYLNDDLGLTLTFFTARSNLLPYAFYMGKYTLLQENVRKSFNGRNLQQMTKVTRCFCGHQNFVAMELSAAAWGYNITSGKC